MNGKETCTREKASSSRTLSRCPITTTFHWKCMNFQLPKSQLVLRIKNYILVLQIENNIWKLMWNCLTIENELLTKRQDKTSDSHRSVKIRTYVRRVFIVLVIHRVIFSCYFHIMRYSLMCAFLVSAVIVNMFWHEIKIHVCCFQQLFCFSFFRSFFYWISIRIYEYVC